MAVAEVTLEPGAMRELHVRLLVSFLVLARSLTYNGAT